MMTSLSDGAVAAQPGPTLHVVSFATWLATDFVAAAAAGDLALHVMSDYGLDVPTALGDPAYWWAPMQYVARLRASGLNLALSTPGLSYLPSVPVELALRTTTLLTVADAAECGAGWFKPAEAKVGAAPAQHYPSGMNFQEHAAAGHMPAMSMVHYTETTLAPIYCEYRCFVTPDAVVVTPYLRDGVTWDGLPPDVPFTADAHAFACDVLSAVGHPPHFVLDVARLCDGRWCVVEANPAWSSNPYALSTDPVMVTAVLGSQHQPSGTGWDWVPDPYYLQPLIARPLPYRR